MNYTFLNARTIFLLLFLAAGMMTGFAQTGAGTGTSMESESVYTLPFATGTTVSASTQFGSSANPYLRQVTLTPLATTTSGTSTMVFAPQTGTLFTTPGTVTYCDSIPPPCPHGYAGILMEVGGEYLSLSGLDLSTLPNFQPGDIIYQGQYIGMLGTTGSLHMEVLAYPDSTEPVGGGMPDSTLPVLPPDQTAMSPVIDSTLPILPPGDSVAGGVPDSTLPIQPPTSQNNGPLDAAGMLIRDWVTVSERTGTYTYDSHNRFIRFCNGTFTGTLNHGQTLTVSGCYSRKNDPAGLTSANLIIYPQPANHQLTFQTNDATTGTTSIQILDAQGRILRAFQGKGSTTTVDIQTLPSGLYFYRFQTGDQLESGKLLIAR